MFLRMSVPLSYQWSHRISISRNSGTHCNSCLCFNSLPFLRVWKKMKSNSTIMHHEKNRLRLIEALYPFFAVAAAAISFNCCWIPRKLHGVSNWFQIDTIYASPFSTQLSCFYGFVRSKRKECMSYGNSLGGRGCEREPPLRWGGLLLGPVTRGMGEIWEGKEPSGCGRAPPRPSGKAP